MCMYLFLSIYVSLAFAMQYLKDISIPAHIYFVNFLILQNTLHKFISKLIYFFHEISKLFYDCYISNKCMFLNMCKYKFLGVELLILHLIQ